MASVTFQNVSKTYRTKKEEICAVRDFNLSIDDQELIVLVGPSGCGKTTTLRLLAGLEEISAGTIQIDQQTVNRIAPKDRDIAMVFQNYALYPHMTVYKNMAFGLKMRKTPKDEIKRKVHQAAHQLGLDHLLDRKPSDLSGGECQRVAVGRAIVRNPRVFLLDEPLANLDARLRMEMRTQIKTLQRTLQTTMIYVTHDQEEAMTLGDRIAVMKNGMIQQCASPLDIYNKPANRFVAEFIGSPAMNLIVGEIEQSHSQLIFHSRLGKIPLPNNTTLHNDETTEKTVLFGIRPEHLHLQNSSPPTNDRPSLSMTVIGIEPLGNRTNVHLRVTHNQPDTPSMVASTPPLIDCIVGQQVTVELDLGRTHFFSSTGDGDRIGFGNESS